MPNHACCRLAISGSEAQRSKFREFAAGEGPLWDDKVRDHTCVFSDTGKCMVCAIKPATLEPLDLNQFVPVPPEYLVGKDGKDAYNSGGYEWVRNNWGTKWGCYDTSVTETGNRLIYDFKAAWCPFNNEVLLTMSSKFPTLKLELKFAERGAEYYGTRIAKGGKLLLNQEIEGRPKSALMRALWRYSG